MPSLADLQKIIQETAVPPGLQFQLAKPSDFRTLADLGFVNQPIHQFRDTFDRLLAWQADGRCCWLVVWQNTAVVGSGQLIVYPHGSELANLYVIPPRRSRGVGTAMITALTAVARALELPTLEISVAASNDRAAALYRRLDFRDDRQVKLLNQEPAIILRKDL